MNVQLILTLVILVAMIVGFLSGKFKLGLVAMTAATLLCLTGVLTFDEAYANFANKNVIMIGGMFILSGALSKTSLVSRVRDFMVSHGDKAKLIIFLYMVINVLLIQVSMPTALASMFLPFMASFTGDSKVKASDLIYPGAVVAHCAQGLMPGAMFVLITAFWKPTMPVWISPPLTTAASSLSPPSSLCFTAALLLPVCCPRETL